jgi:hypothetical protein
VVEDVVPDEGLADGGSGKLGKFFEMSSMLV